MTSEQISESQEVQVERRIIGEGYTIEFLGALPESNQVVITLPGVGDVASLHFSNLTNNLEEKPLGLAVSYLQQFNPAKLVGGLVTTLTHLAEQNGQINLVIHACSYGASLLPSLTKSLAVLKNITVKGIIARAPLFDAETFTETFQNFRNKDKLVLAFTIGMKELFNKGEITIPENFASLSELFAQLPETVDPTFIPLLHSKIIPIRTILFSNDQIIDKEVVSAILGTQKALIEAESGEERSGHYPKDLVSFTADEQKLLVSLFAAE